MSLKKLDWSGLNSLENTPMVHSCISNQTQRICTEPLPEKNIFIHCRGLKLGFLRQVKYLKRPLIRLEGDDLLVPVHNGTVSLNWPPNDLIIVLQVNDYNLGIGVLAGFLSNANEVVGLQSL